jgi:trimethylamine corrinoid protein
MDTEEEIFKEIIQTIMNFDGENAKSIVEKTIEYEINPVEVVEKGIAPALKELGSKFERYEIFLPEMLIAAEIVKTCMKLLEPRIPKGANVSLGTIVIGTAAGDIHDIGKKFVATMLSAAGFLVSDIGKDVHAMRFIEESDSVNANFVGISTLLSTCMNEQKKVIDMLSELGSRAKYKIIIGGGCVTPEWSEQIGADGYAPDASSTVDLVKKLIS